MATLRDPKTDPLLGLEQKLRAVAPLRFRDERLTRDAIELEAIDEQTGQIALVTVSRVNRGHCPGCGHVSHAGAERCEAFRAFTKDRCPCAVWHFPEPDDAEAARA